MKWFIKLIMSLFSSTNTKAEVKPPANLPVHEDESSNTGIVEYVRGSLPWIEEGLKLLGEKEIAGSSKTNKKISQLFFDVVGKWLDDGTAWCMGFIMACCKRAGMKFLKTLWAADLKKYNNPCELKVGAMASRYSSVANSKRHVFFIFRINWIKKTVTVLEGNGANSCRFSEVKISDLIDIQWPVKA